MAKAHLRSKDPLHHMTFTGEADGYTRPSIARIIDEHHDKMAKTIQSKRSR